MFKKSFTLVFAIVALVFTSAFTSQWLSVQNIPSSYDSGLTIDEAFKTSKTPLLVEFYSDTCGTCRQVAPMVHEIELQHKDKLTLVMINTDAPENQQFAELFGVDALPSLFVFDPMHMKKQPVPATSFGSQVALEKTILSLLTPQAS